MPSGGGSGQSPWMICRRAKSIISPRNGVNDRPTMVETSIKMPSMSMMTEEEMSKALAECGWESKWELRDAVQSWRASPILAGTGRAPMSDCVQSQRKRETPITPRRSSHNRHGGAAGLRISDAVSSGASRSSRVMNPPCGDYEIGQYSNDGSVAPATRHEGVTAVSTALLGLASFPFLMPRRDSN